MKSTRWKVICSTIMRYVAQMYLGSSDIMMQFIEASWSTAKDTTMESWFIAKIEFMKGYGSMITDKARAWNGIQMVTNMRVTSSKEKHVVRESTTGQMEKCTTVNGKAE